jgi:hypothetical protein
MRSFIACMILLVAASLSARADEACTDFKWDVSKERSLFATAPTPLNAGADAKTAPTVLLDKLYQIQLVSQASVKFALEPGRKSHADSDHAGIATLKLPANGSYRISIDMPLWIDVVSNAALVSAKDFQSQRDCKSPHKIVEFELPADQTVTLQFSSSAADSVGMTVTASPVRKF